MTATSAVAFSPQRLSEHGLDTFVGRAATRPSGSVAQAQYLGLILVLASNSSFLLIGGNGDGSSDWGPTTHRIVPGSQLWPC